MLRASSSSSAEHPAPVVGDDDLDEPPRCSAASSTGRASGFPAPRARSGVSIPWRNRVPEQVHEGLGEPLEDDAVELGVNPVIDELDLLALGGRDVAHGPGERGR